MNELENAIFAIETIGGTVTKKTESKTNEFKHIYKSSDLEDEYELTYGGKTTSKTASELIKLAKLNKWI